MLSVPPHEIRITLARECLDNTADDVRRIRARTVLVLLYPPAWGAAASGREPNMVRSLPAVYCVGWAMPLLVTTWTVRDKLPAAAREIVRSVR